MTTTTTIANPLGLRSPTRTDQITVLYLCCGNVVWVNGGYEELARWDDPPAFFWDCRDCNAKCTISGHEVKTILYGGPVDEIAGDKIAARMIEQENARGHADA